MLLSPYFFFRLYGDHRDLHGLTNSFPTRRSADLAILLSTYDWRTSTGEGLTEDERVRKLAFRGSGGYKELRRQLLNVLSEAEGAVGQSARAVIKIGRAHV